MDIQEKSPVICELCITPGGTVLWQDAQCRVVLVNEAGYPGFCRVIWKTHVREMSDLDAAERTHCMQVVFAVERVLRKTLNPDKINLASLGNMVTHVHWHIIPRFADDPHFPQPIWAARQRTDPPARPELDPATLLTSLAAALKSELNQ
jgi:diadenosine tetraphosphate (Ap4A) HIT family hydrolase